MHKPYDEKVKIGYDRMLRVKEMLNLGVINTPVAGVLYDDKDMVNKQLIYNLVTLNSFDYEKIKEDIIKNKKVGISQEEMLNKVNLFLEERNNELSEKLKSSGINLNDLYKLNSPYIETHKDSSSVWAKYYINNPLNIDKEMFSGCFNLYKVYASFDNFKDLNKQNLEKIVNDLGEKGIWGAFKVIGDTSRLYSSDQICFYATSFDDQKLIYEYLTNCCDNLNEVSCGIDVGVHSFSTLLAAGNFFEYTSSINIENRESLIKEFIDCLDTNKLARCVKLDEELLMLTTEKNLKKFGEYDNQTRNFLISSFFERLEKQDLSEAYIKKYENYLKDFLEMQKLETSEKYSENYIREHQDETKWRYVFSSKDFSIEFLEEFKHKSDTFGDDISSNPYITKEIVDKFKDEINFKKLSCNKYLTEDIIKEYKEFLDMNSVSSCIKLSYDFMEQNIEDLHLTNLVHNRHINFEVKRNLRESFFEVFEAEDIVRDILFHSTTDAEELILLNVDKFSLSQLDRLVDTFVKYKEYTDEESNLDFVDLKKYKELRENYNLLDLKENILNELIDIKELPNEILESKLFIGNLILLDNFDFERLPTNIQENDLLLKLDEINREKNETISLVD